jgi:hypothetical protein
VLIATATNAYTIGFVLSCFDQPMTVIKLMSSRYHIKFQVKWSRDGGGLKRWVTIDPEFLGYSVIVMMRPRKSWDRLYFSEFYAYKMTKDLRTGLMNILSLV